MDLHADDAAFVRAPAELVYRRLTDVARWPTWWAGVRVRPMPLDGGGETWAIELAGAPLRRLRLAARLHGWRHDQGFLLTLWGDVDGRGEFWLEAANGGTIVHHLLAGSTRRRPVRAVVSDHRRAIRRGLWGLKDVLQLEARTAGGLAP